MSELPPQRTEEHLPGYEPYVGEVGVMDAVRMGWNLLMSDFWPIWLLGLVAYAVNLGCSIPNMIPYIGACFALATGIFVVPPLFAGLFYAVARVIDGQQADVGQVFEGFRQRYWPSVVAMLVPMAVGVGCFLVLGLLIGVTVAILVNAGVDDDMVPVIIILIGLPAYIIILLVMLLFVFSFLTVWHHPESGWEAVKDSARVVKAHYGSMVGFGLLFGLIGFVAALAGLIACGVGILFTAPLVMVWFHASLIYLYRSWTGQPLTQPLAEETAGKVPPPAPPGAAPPPAPPADESPSGPVPPSDVEMPPT